MTSQDQLNILEELGFDVKETCLHGAYHFSKDGHGLIQAYLNDPTAKGGISIGWCKDEWKWFYPTTKQEIISIVNKAKKELNIK